MRLLLCFAIACGSPTQPIKPAPVVTPDAAPVDAAPAPVAEKSCDATVDLTKSEEALNCARDLMKQGVYDVADHIAEDLMKRYPYSKRAMQSEILRIDILAARGNYADAADGYDRFLKFHPTHDDKDEILKKLEAARSHIKD